jgi:hypothetical protein
VLSGARLGGRVRVSGPPSGPPAARMSVAGGTRRIDLYAVRGSSSADHLEGAGPDVLGPAPVVVGEVRPHSLRRCTLARATRPQDDPHHREDNHVRHPLSADLSAAPQRVDDHKRRHREHMDRLFLEAQVKGPAPSPRFCDGVPMSDGERQQCSARWERARPRRIRQVFGRLRGAHARTRPPRARSACGGRRRPGRRRVVSRSAGGGSSGEPHLGDDDPPGELARRTHRRLDPIASPSATLPFALLDVERRWRG